MGYSWIFTGSCEAVDALRALKEDGAIFVLVVEFKHQAGVTVVHGYCQFMTDRSEQSFSDYSCLGFLSSINEVEVYGPFYANKGVISYGQPRPKLDKLKDSCNYLRRHVRNKLKRVASQAIETEGKKIVEELTNAASSGVTDVLKQLI